MLRRYLTLWLVLSSGVAFWWPSLAGSLKTGEQSDPFVWGARTLSPSVAITMVCIGALLPVEEVRRMVRRWITVLYGTGVQYITMPALAWCICELWGLEGDLRTGVLIVGCVPGAMASNVLTLAARGNVSYSIGLTTSATLLSPLVVPLALGLTAGNRVTPDQLADTCRALVWTVVLPVLGGYLACRLSTGFDRVMQRIAEPLANLTILWVIAVVVGLQRDRLSAAGSVEYLADLIAALLLINLLGYLAGYMAGAAVRFPEPMRRALTIEVGMQNAGVGTALAARILGPDSPGLVPTAMYTFGCMLTGTILAQLFAMRPLPEDSPPSAAAP